LYGTNPELERRLRSLYGGKLVTPKSYWMFTTSENVNEKESLFNRLITKVNKTITIKIYFFFKRVTFLMF